MRPLFCLLLACSSGLLQAQTVYPIESAAYADSLHPGRSDGGKDSVILRLADPYYGFYYGDAVGYRIRNNKVEFYGQYTRRIVLEGYVSASVGRSWASAGPDLQNEYVQGQPLNGKLTWQGPETSVPYSFGPSVHQLAFDHSVYAYDRQGQLVTSAVGGAQPYDNSLSEPTSSNQQTIFTRWSVQASRRDKLSFSIRTSRKQDPDIFPATRNRLNSMETGVQWNVGRWELSHHLILNGGKVGNANNYGYLNAVYRNQLLTPISFENAQGYLMPGGSRFFAPGFAHPYYMLGADARQSSFFEHHQYIQAAFKSSRFSLQITPAFDEENRMDDLDPSQHYEREQIVRRKRLQTAGSWQIRPNANFLKLNFGSLIQHDRTDYDYNYKNDLRVSRFYQDHRLAFQYLHNNHFPFDLNAGNNFYASNTAGFRGFSPNAKIRLGNFHPGPFEFSFQYEWAGGWKEADVTQSRAVSAYRSFSIESIASFLPNMEVAQYANINPTRTWQQEWSTQFRWQQLRFGASWNRSRMNGQQYAVLQNNQLHVQNLADELHQSLTLGLSFNTSRRNLRTDSRISFFRERERVLSLRQPGDVVAIGGFKEVYTALVAGQAPGVIMGSAFKRNGEGRILIGSDGFPLVDRDVIIGSPIPQFSMNWSQSFSFKNLGFSYSLTWNKGGQLWDGTEAVLDYYGRSATSATQRENHHVIFDGVDASGHQNTIAVDLLDPSKTLSESWFQRYGPGGIAERYIKPADQLRLNDVALTYKFSEVFRTHAITLSAGLTNVVLWSKSGNRNLNRLFADSGTFRSLNLFNLPNTQTLLLGFKFQL